jgi:hypothetical protein
MYNEKEIKLRIINETINEYNINNRSNFGATCYYVNPLRKNKHKNCAIGRLCIEPHQLRENLNASNLIKWFGNKIIKVLMLVIS